VTDQNLFVVEHIVDDERMHAVHCPLANLDHLDRSFGSPFQSTTCTSRSWLGQR
jgi:hypothetical protein